MNNWSINQPVNPCFKPDEAVRRQRLTWSWAPPLTRRHPGCRRSAKRGCCTSFPRGRTRCTCRCSRAACCWWTAGPPWSAASSARPPSGPNGCSAETKRKKILATFQDLKLVVLLCLSRQHQSINQSISQSIDLSIYLSDQQTCSTFSSHWTSTRARHRGRRSISASGSSLPYLVTSEWYLQKKKKKRHIAQSGFRHNMNFNTLCDWSLQSCIMSRRWQKNSHPVLE